MGSYVLWFILLFCKYLVFRNSSSLLLNGYSIYGLCLTFWTNEFLGSYSNYKFIISFSIFSCQRIRKDQTSGWVYCLLHKNAGFIILLTSILILFIFGEIRNLTTLCLLNNNSFHLSFFFLSFLSFLWIDAQFPQEKFLSYARILTLYYYFLLMCILFSFLFDFMFFL